MRPLRGTNDLGRHRFRNAGSPFRVRGCVQGGAAQSEPFSTWLRAWGRAPLTGAGICRPRHV